MYWKNEWQNRKIRKNTGEIYGKIVIIIENMVAKLENLKNVTEKQVAKLENFKNMMEIWWNN